MIEGGSGARLSQEAGLGRMVAGAFGGQHFDGDVAVQPAVVPEVDFTHAARAQLTDDLVRTEPFSSALSI